MNYNQSNIHDNSISYNYVNFDFTQLSKKELSAIQNECSHYSNIKAASIGALKIIQKHRGWVSDDSILLVSQILNISVSDVEGVATFYNQIFRQPVGKYIIRYCDSIVCYIAGCEKLQVILENILNIKIGDTTKDKKFTLLPICCIGRCDIAPVIMINNDIYSCTVSSKIIKLLSLYK